MRSGRRPRALILLMGGIVLVLLVGAGAWLLLAGPTTDPLDGSRIGEWPATAEPLSPGGDVTATTTAVTLADGTTIRTTESIELYVVAGTGVYFVPADDGAGWAELELATRAGVRGTGARPDPETLHVSPNGRYLAFIERGRTPAAAVVVDLREGKEVVRSTEGMGTPGSPPELYDNEPPDVYGVTDTHAYFSTPEGAWAWDLRSGDVTFEGDAVSTIQDSDWYAALREPGATFGPRAPG